MQSHSQNRTNAIFVNKENRMIDPVKILKRACYILWSYRALWIFGLILALAAGSGGGRGSGNNGVRFDQNGSNQQVTPHHVQQGWREFQNEIHKIFTQGIPEAHITGREITTFLWVI